MHAAPSILGFVLAIDHPNTTSVLVSDPDLPTLDVI